MAVKARFKGTAWTRWAQDIRLRWQNALDYYRRELYYDIENSTNTFSSNSASSGKN
ncbi:MAG: hypothetical protein ACLTBV_34065 [Enterocloster bolteae]